MKKQFVVLLMVLGLFVFGRMGQAADETTEPPLMAETVVTATRYEEEVSTLPANVTVITEKDISNSTAHDVPSILKSKGIHVYDISGNRRAYRVDLRGFGETSQLNTLVLVDGRRINQPDLSGTDWALIPLDRVERIEIIRGGRGGVLYGDNASGGVINIITKEGEALEVGGKLAGGSYETFSADAYVSGTQNNLSYALSGSYYDSDGYRDNSATEAKDLGLNLAYFFSDLVKLNISGGYHEDDTRNPGTITASEFASGVSRTDTLNPDDFSEFEDYYVKMKPEIFFLKNSHALIDLSFRKRDTFFFNSFRGFFTGTFEANTEIETLRASPQLIFKEEVLGFRNNLTFGFDFEKAEEDIINTPSYAPTAEFRLEKENHGFYFHEEFYPLNSLTLSAGYRYDKVEYKFEPSVPSEADFDENIFTAGINYNFHKDSYVYFSYAVSFRYPVLDEYFDFTNNTIFTDLIPQTSENYELGIRYHFNPTFYTNLNFFRLDTDDEIFFNTATFKNENLDGETRRTGIEVEVGKTFKNATLTGSYTYTDAEIKKGQFSGNEVPNVPEHKAAFDAVFYPIEGFTIALNGIYIGERVFESDFENAFPEQDDYVVLNLKFKYNWRKYSAFLDINNLLDEEYEEYGVIAGPQPAFSPSPEINFLVGVSAVF